MIEGRLSVNAAPVAVPGPPFVSVIVHENDWPASTVCVAGSFVIERIDQRPNET